MLTAFDKSAILGFYRNGMKVENIAILVGVTSWEVEKLIQDYLNLKDGQENHNQRSEAGSKKR